MAVDPKIDRRVFYVLSVTLKLLRLRFWALSEWLVVALRRKPARLSMKKELLPKRAKSPPPVHAERRAPPGRVHADLADFREGRPVVEVRAEVDDRRVRVEARLEDLGVGIAELGAPARRRDDYQSGASHDAADVRHIEGMEPLYAVVGMDSPALSVTVNFGAEAPFELPDEQRRHLERVLCPGSAWARGYPPGMAPEGDSDDDSDGDFDEGDTSDEESLLGLFVDQGVS